MGTTIASFVGQRRELQDAGSDGDLIGMESINLKRYSVDFCRIFRSAVMFIIQPSLVRRDLRIDSSDDDISDHSSLTFGSRFFKNSK